MTQPVSPTPDRDIASPALLTPQEVAEFQRLMKEECGEVLDASQAYLRAKELIHLMRILAVRVEDENPLLHPKDDRPSPTAKPVATPASTPESSTTSTAPAGTMIVFQ